MKTFVNVLTIFRIFASFAIIGTFMAGMYTTTTVLFFLAALSDFFDGYLARKYNACTKLGGVMDSIADKFLVINTFVLLCAKIPVWYYVTPMVIMISRELYISGLREFMGTQKMDAPHAHSRFSFGKIKAALQMIFILSVLCLLSLGSLIYTSPQIGSRFVLYAIITLPYIALICLYGATISSIISAINYTVNFTNQLKKTK